MARIDELEMDAKQAFPNPAVYPITFDGNKTPLRIICELTKIMRQLSGITYRRGGLELTRDQAIDLIRRQQQHEATK